MNKKMVYVIQDQQGNYITPKKIDDEHNFLVYTGIGTGFTFYATEEAAGAKLSTLADLGFSLNRVRFDSIPFGKRLPVQAV